MALSDSQIKQLSSRLQIPLAGVYFKDEIPDKPYFNNLYVINLESSEDEQGNPSDGSHWVCFQINKYKNGVIESIYFDPYGVAPPEDVKKFIQKHSGKKIIPYTTKDVQSLMNNACGFFCLALGHFINSSPYRSGILYEDVNSFMYMFDDLNESVDWKKNEYILQHFFRSKDPKLRKEIDVIKSTHSITGENLPGKDLLKIPVEMKQI